MTDVLGIIQARCNSSRLPGKVLKLILGRPMLQLQIERTIESKMLNKIIVATSNESSDDPIDKLCNSLGVDCYRGSLVDVLERFYKSAKHYNAQHILRMTGDCPLIDFRVVDNLIEQHLQTGSDYSSNVMNETFPDGLDAEIFTFQELECAFNNATLKSDREHVTPFIRRTAKYKSTLDNNVNLNHHRWTVDELNDFNFVSKIFEHFSSDIKAFSMEDVLALLNEQPELAKINCDITRNEGYIKSIERD